ncbi:hypothetical protein Bca52824_014034 [Brassica carinata]|uniref:Uncharacterized protein n=1 Tax=Brassica carinata TaxID=52824 RepID=A0A8X7W003_BRACI|nr:hypothetical protein Bca52824_014034 [Brassica carinata]
MILLILNITPNSCASESSSRFTLLGEVDEVETEPYSSLSFIRGEREIKLPAKYQDIEWKTVRGRGKCGRRVADPIISYCLSL